eukprot:GFUD01012593.1.p1 GENE.GFUD01012593.1~~GFUD01012593.1.p1  ORF type:complete len:291 (+),score=103.16 GFUD01012593.1:62-874(+)
MAAVSRIGRTSASVKRARLEAERSKVSARMDLNGGREETDKNEEMKEKNRFDFIFKLVFIGDSDCGKTCLLARFCGESCQDKSDSTFIADFHIKTIEMDGNRIKLEMWDISGQDKFEHLGSMFYTGSSAVILAYDVTRRHTLATCVARDRVFQDMDQGNDPVKFLIGCKADLEDEREVDEEEAQDVATEIGARWFETSSVVEGKAEFLIQKIVRNILERNETESFSQSSDGCDTMEMGDSPEQEVAVLEEERDGAFGMLKKLLHWNWSDM